MMGTTFVIISSGTTRTSKESIKQIEEYEPGALKDEVYNALGTVEQSGDKVKKRPKKRAE